MRPGRQVTRTVVTAQLALPFDTTLHYINVHAHPFAESLTLRDVTTGQTVFETRVRRFEDRLGVAHLEHFSSQAGIPVLKDHAYELISVYDNSTSVDQDAMAVMYLIFA